MVDTNDRRRRRRSRNLGGSTRAGTEARGLPYDGQSDLGSINDRVANTVPTLPSQQAIPNSSAETPSSRVKDIGKRASAYEKEYRLKLLHRLLMRGIPLDRIATELEVSVSTVMRNRKELYKQLRQQAQGLDSNELIGDTLGFYAEIQGMSLRTASTDKNPMNVRLAALRTALSAKNDSHRFLQAAGVFDALQFSPDEDTSNGDLDMLMELTQKMLGMDDDVEFESDESITGGMEGFDLEDEEKVRVG